MIGLSFFEGDAEEAIRILEAMGRVASERTGHACTFSLATSLDEVDVARVVELQREAFGADDVAFSRRDLDEVRADPEALFVRLDVDGRLEGCFFGYWEWPEKVTVPGTDFFLDSAIVSARYRGLGIGHFAITGILLLADLLECRRIGIAAWLGGPGGTKLVRFYRSFGFARMADGPHMKMALALDDEKLARYRIDLRLRPDADALPTPGRAWPRADERALAGRFYLAMGMAETLYLVAPFEFAYLYLTMERPDWAVLATLSGVLAAVVAAVPAGIIADRRSRKLAVLLGGITVGLGLIAVPAAVRASGGAQLLAACAAFAVMGIGETLMTGAAEAWAVDNLEAAGRPDLIESFFGRMKSVSAAGAALAATGALIILLLITVGRGVIDLLWIAGGVGFLAGSLLMLRIPEDRSRLAEEEDDGVWPRLREAFGVLGGRRALAMIAGAIVLGTASGAAAQEAFTVSLITRHFDARFFAPLSIVDSMIGAVGPIIGIALARRMGAKRMLAFVLALEGLSLSLLFTGGGIAPLLGVYVLLDLLDDSWDPVALARMQSLTPSAHRATISTVVYEIGSVAELAALGVFALMLGKNREALEQATPDLLDAFSGKPVAAPSMPSVWLGLSITDLAIVLFVGLGVVAIPLVLAGDGRTPKPTARDATVPPRSARGSESAQPTPGSVAAR